MKICSGAKQCTDKNCYAKIAHEYMVGACLPKDRTQYCIISDKVWCEDVPEENVSQNTAKEESINIITPKNKGQLVTFELLYELVILGESKNA